MATYGQMQSRIAREIKRANLTTEIQECIQTAIQAYEARPLWFNQQRGTLSLTAGTKIYGLPADPNPGEIGVFKKMRSIRLLSPGAANYDKPLDEYTREEAMENDTNTPGYPDHYFIDYLQKTAITFNRATVGQIWFLPVPNAAFTAELHFFRELGTLSASSDENAWTNEAEVLIRCRAKRELYTHVIRDVGEAMKFAAAEKDALADLQKENAMARAPARVRAAW